MESEDEGKYSIPPYSPPPPYPGNSSQSSCDEVYEAVRETFPPPPKPNNNKYPTKEDLPPPQMTGDSYDSDAFSQYVSMENVRPSDPHELPTKSRGQSRSMCNLLERYTKRTAPYSSGRHIENLEHDHRPRPRIPARFRSANNLQEPYPESTVPEPHPEHIVPYPLGGNSRGYNLAQQYPSVNTTYSLPNNPVGFIPVQEPCPAPVAPYPQGAPYPPGAAYQPAGNLIVSQPVQAPHPQPTGVRSTPENSQSAAAPERGGINIVIHNDRAPDHGSDACHAQLPLLQGMQTVAAMGQMASAVAAGNAKYGHKPQMAACTMCGRRVLTTVKYRYGLLTYLVIATFVVLFAGDFVYIILSGSDPGVCVVVVGLICCCCFIPLCCRCCKDAEHKCPGCNTFLGRHKKL